MVGGNTHIAEISYDHYASASGKNRYSAVPSLLRSPTMLRGSMLLRLRISGLKRLNEAHF